MLILKTFIDTAFHCIISNFEKKNGSIVNKRLFLHKFSVDSFFHERLSCVKKNQPKGNLIELSTFLKYGFTKVKKAQS